MGDNTQPLSITIHEALASLLLLKKPRKSEYDQEIPQSHTADKPMVHCLLIKYIRAGHYRSTSETPFKWRFAGVPIAVR